MESNFTDCQFESINMTGSVFTQCELIRPKFDKVPTLKSVALFESKVWDSEKCIEVNASDNVSKIIDNLKD